MSDPTGDQNPSAVPEKREPVEATDKPVETPAETPEPATENTDQTAAEPASAPVKNEDPAKDAAAAPAATTEPEATKTEATKPEPKVEKPAYLTKNPALSELFDRLPTILGNVGHSEMWGITLKESDDIPTVNVLIKFLRANEGNAKAAESQLTKALQWRKEVNPSALAESAKYSAAKYGGLGYLTTYEEDGRPLVFTWNIYGAVKDIATTFSNTDE